MGRCRMTALAGACEGDGREEVRLGKVRPSYWIESEGLTGGPKQCREMKNWMQNSRKNWLWLAATCMWEQDWGEFEANFSISFMETLKYQPHTIFTCFYVNILSGLKGSRAF